MDKNDLAIIRFKDISSYYAKLFSTDKDIVHLYCSDYLPAISINYGLYGYPCPTDTHSKAKRGELWGMEALSYKIDNNYNIKMYIKRNR